MVCREKGVTVLVHRVADDHLKQFISARVALISIYS